jgi:hypothetical protein
MAPHPAVIKSYTFHGTFNPLLAGDHIEYDDDFFFAVEVGGQPGHGHIHLTGAIHQNN